MAVIEQIAFFFVFVFPIALLLILGWKQSRKRWPVWRYISDRLQVRFALITVLLAFLVFLYGYSRGWMDESFQKGLFVEFGGATFDIIIFGVLLAAASALYERDQEKKRQQEIIDDFRKWNTTQGNLRIAGAIRRLNRLGITAINFRGLELSDFAFLEHEIHSLKGSSFYDGAWGEKHKTSNVILKKISFDETNCSDVIFSPHTSLFLKKEKPEARNVVIRDCTFRNTNLENTIFNGATLIGDCQETGKNPASEAPFAGANMRHASFRGCHFENIDFRHAEGLDKANFSDATGLETCLFDEGAKARLQR